MQEQTLSVFSALQELTKLPEQIADAISKMQVIGTKLQSETGINGMPLKDFMDLAKRSDQRVCSMIAREQALKGAIDKYKATTLVTIGSSSYTITQVEWMLAHGISEKKKLLNQYNNLLHLAERECDDDEPTFSNLSDCFAEKTVGVRNDLNAAEYSNAAETYRKQHKRIMIDPLCLKNQITALEKEISEFLEQAEKAVTAVNVVSNVTIAW